MEHYAKETYGDRIADVYDEAFRHLDPTDAAAFLAELAGSGTVLELGIGTGRIALPLAEQGVEIAGIDASPGMVEKLRAKPGGEAIDVSIGDFSAFSLNRTFGVVFVAFNTLFMLLEQEEQLRCFTCVAEHLDAGGRFVVECFVPDLSRFTRDQAIVTTAIETDLVRIDANVHDGARQTVQGQHIYIQDGKLEMFPIALRYIWPSELDLMARLAGFEREARYGGWKREPFTKASGSHVSVYVKR
jgi:SAM-dependent methyltransferase